MKKLSIILVSMLVVVFVNAKTVAVSGYKIENKIHLEGDEKWDYLYSDDATSRLYVSHGSAVQVVDEVNGEVIGKITGLKGVHGIATDPASGKGYITSGKDSSVTVFDTKTFLPLTKIIVGANPDAIIFEPFSKKVYVFNAKSNSASVIDPATDIVIATIALESNPEAAVSDNNGKLYVNLESAGKIAVINVTLLKVETNWSVAPGEEPTGIALDPQTHRLFTACHNKLAIIVDATNGKVITTLPIGQRVDGAAFDPELKRAYTSNGEGTITVIGEENENSFKVLETIPTQKGARTIALNKTTHHIYVSTADFGPAAEGERPKLLPGTFVVLDIAPKDR